MSVMGNEIQAFFLKEQICLRALELHVFKSFVFFFFKYLHLAKNEIYFKQGIQQGI